MGNGPAVRGLLELQKREDPDVLFLSETKMRKEKLEGLRWKLGMPNMMVKECDGLSGGLAIFWKNTINLRVLPFMSKYHIDTEITESDRFVWRFTGIYGKPKTEEREKTWNLLRTLKNQSDKPWLCAGDFNEILFSWEKEGGVPKPQKQIDKFREALEYCGLDDLDS
jgi:exonuclease III